MALTSEKTKREWIISREGNVSVSIGIENGKADKEAKITGLSSLKSVTYTDLPRLQAFWKALTELLQEVRAAQERTKPREE